MKVGGEVPLRGFPCGVFAAQMNRTRMTRMKRIYADQFLPVRRLLHLKEKIRGHPSNPRHPRSIRSAGAIRILFRLRSKPSRSESNKFGRQNYSS
jgi:hypothetical protein